MKIHAFLILPFFFLAACAGPIEQKLPVGLKKEPKRQLVGTFVPDRNENIALS